MSKKVKRIIGTKNFRIASICAAVVFFVGIVGIIAINAFGADLPTAAYYGEIDPDTGRPEYEDEFVLGKNIYNTTTHKFTVLEIAPYEGYGELGYMVDNELGYVKLSDIKKLENEGKGSQVLSDWKQTVYSFISTSGGWKNVSDDGYVEHKVDPDKGEEGTIYEVDGKYYYDRNFFARGLTGHSFLSNKFDVITKSATEVTVEDVKKADLVFISNGSHANTKTTYDAMAAAARNSGNAELIARYPQSGFATTYSATNDISKEVATAIVEHNIFNDKAVIFDKAAGNGTADKYLVKLYYMLLGIDSDDFRDEFVAEEVHNETVGGQLVTNGYKGSMGYFDTDKFEIHYVGPEGKYGNMGGYELNKDGEWVFSSNLNHVQASQFGIERYETKYINAYYGMPLNEFFSQNGVDWSFINSTSLPPELRNITTWFNGDTRINKNINNVPYQVKLDYVDIKAGEKLTDYNIPVDTNSKLNWDAGMFLYQIGQKVMNKTTNEKNGEEWRPFYYNSNSGEEGYMNGSIYVFNGDCSLTQEMYHAASTGGGQHRDNDYDQAKDIYGDKITNNQIIEYLLGIYPFENQPPIKVLEIQPAGFYDYSVADQSIVTRKIKDFQTAINIMYMIGGDTSILTRKNFETKVKVTSISVNGFNGLTDDLKSQYDLIIVDTKSGDDGTNPESIPATEGIGGISINTTRRDDKLNGLIYTPIGDIFSLKVNNVAPNLNTKANYYANYSAVTPGYTRMTGNDFTEKSYNKIVEYAVDKNMPLILADDIYNGNDKKIGSTTYVYKLSELAKRDNVLTMREANLAHNFGLKEAFWDVAKKRAKITIYSPGKLEYDDNMVDTDSPSFITKATIDAKSMVTFTGNVRGAKDTAYRYAIYIDKNGDGIYRTDNVVDDNNEIFASGTLMMDATGSLKEMSGATLSEVQIKDKDGKVTGSRTDFSISVELTDSMLGYYMWRMVVTEAKDDSTGVESATDGAFVIRASKDTANKVVKVLQIIPDLRDSRFVAGASGGYSTFSKYNKKLSDYPLKLLISSDYASKFFAGTALEENAVHFNELFEAAETVTGIELEIDTMTTTGYENLFLTLENNKYVDKGYKSYRDENDYEDADRNPLNEYNMVVIGFSDKYSLDTIGNNQGAVDLLKEYAGRGNAVLFAHDSMMYSNYSDGYYTAPFSAITYGTDVNNNSMVNILRSVSGQDRYGVSTSIAGTNKVASDNTSEYWTNEKLPTITSGATTYKYRDLGQLQGFTTNMLARYTEKFNNKKIQYSNFFNGISNNSVSINNTTQATKLNMGQVTQYPYLIEDQLDISTTHGQWYQLDLEAKENKSEEVVVWYVLTSDHTDTSNMTDMQKLYTANGVDAINDYYIYSKGSVTYSGAGHSDINGDAEQRLFVNTIIRAITSANSKPVASFESAVITDEKNHLYTQYLREEIGNGDKEQSVIVTFMGQDDDLRKPENMSDTTAGQFKEAFVYWDVNDNKAYDEGVDKILGTTYRIKVNPLYNMIPKSIDLKDYYNTSATYKNSQGVNITTTLKAALNSNEARLGLVVKDSNGGKGLASVKFVLRELFDLN